MARPFREFKLISSFWSWAIIVALCATLIGWGIVAYLLIPSTPRHWDFDALPDTPSQSIYSTRRVRGQASPPPQIQMLPEAQTRPATGPADTPEEQP